MKATAVFLLAILCAQSMGGASGDRQMDTPSIPESSGYIVDPGWDAPFPYRSIVQMEAEAAGVPAWILAAVIEYESGWDETHCNQNDNGTTDYGIAQLNSKYLEYFAEQFNDGLWIDPFNPLVSIRVAARYLARNYESFGSWEYAVAAYNCGPGRAKSRPWPVKTERYIREVFR